MVKIYLGILGLLLSFSGFAQQINYNDGWGDPGLTITTQTGESVALNYTIDEFTIGDKRINEEFMKEIYLGDVFLPNNEGAPNLPGMGRYIAVPRGASVKMKVLNYRTEKFEDIYLAPSPRIPWDTETTPLEYEKDESIYLVDEFYPQDPVQLSAMTSIRGIDAVMLGITPFQYNPVTRELLVYRDIEVEITFENSSGQFGEDRLRSRWWDPVIRNVFLNHESIPQINYNHAFQGTKDMGCEYLIVTPNSEEFQAWADSIRVFRTMQGIRTKVVTLEEIGGNTVNILENYFNDVYSTWDVVPAAVLLLGDYSTNADEGIISPIWNNYCASDNIFADVNNNDMPDIIFARITAQNESQLETMISKFLNYERTPPVDPGFYDHPITALGWQTERWFQICSETVGGFWKNGLGKNPVRVNEVYGGNPDSDPWSTATNTYTVLNYFGPNGLGYLPSSPSDLGDWSGGDADDINTAINNGSFMLQHRDHGFELGWGEPDYTNSDINGLTNTDLSFIMSINCLTGKYNISYESFAEKFHRYTSNGENSGALGLIAASEVSYSFVNDAFVWGVYDNMWPDFLPAFGSSVDYMGILPAFGNAAGKFFLMQSSWPYNTSNKEVTYNLFHHHGDAFLTVYSEIPEELVIIHDEHLLEGATSFSFHTTPGTLICLTVDGEIIATAKAESEMTEISIPAQSAGDMVFITATKQNYYRHESSVDVIDSDIPYVVHDSNTLNDEAGNSDNMMDYGETINLDVTMENIGNLDANSVEVSLSTQNEYITITDDSEVYGDFPAGSSILIDNAFAFDVDNLIPDNENVFFELLATDGTSNWTSQVVYKSHAPALQFLDYTISDPDGNNNGRIDPGETVQLTVFVANNGSSSAFEVMGVLGSAYPGITVESSTLSFGDLFQNDVAEQTFDVVADATVEDGVEVEFTIDLTAQGGIEASGSIEVVVGRILALVLDLDMLHYSGPGIYDVFDDMDTYVEYSTTFPEDLGQYKSIFVCLGLHFTNYELSNEEGEKLKTFMLNGGNVYMEGRVTWKNDPQTPVHEMFSTEVVPMSMYLINEVNGYPGSLTWNMNFGYEGNNPVCDYSLEAVSPAYNLFTTEDDEHKSMVAYNAVTYRSIASTVEFGKLVDGDDPATKAQLMQLFLDWFEGTITSINEPVFSAESPLTFNPNPFHHQTSLNINLTSDVEIDLKIIDIHGKEIKQIYGGPANKGTHHFSWDGSSDKNEKCTPGIYFGLLRVDGRVYTEKIILMTR